MVYKVASFHHRQICGSSSRTPRWAIAHKFPPLSAITRLLDIEIQVGRTGALTPVAILDLVELGGVMVARASNFHYARKMLLPSSVRSRRSSSEEIIEEHDSSRPALCVRKGISVLVSQSGDVMLQVMKRVFDDDDGEVVSVNHSDDTISLESPRQFPACGSPTSLEFVRTSLKKKKKKSSATQTPAEGTVMQIIRYDSEESNNTEGGQVLRCSGPQLLSSTNFDFFSFPRSSSTISDFIARNLIVARASLVRLSSAMKRVSEMKFESFEKASRELSIRHDQVQAIIRRIEDFQRHFASWTEEKQDLEREKLKLHMRVVSLERGLDNKSSQIDQQTQKLKDLMITSEGSDDNHHATRRKTAEETTFY